MSDNNNIIICGGKGTGKSCTGYTILSKSQQDKYVYMCPNEDFLKKLPFKVQSINNIKDLFGLENSIILIDEADNEFNPIEKKVNEQLRLLLKLSRQNNNSIIFIVHNTYFLNRSLFNFIDTFIFKETTEGHFEIERPHIKKLFQTKAQQVRGVNKAYIRTPYGEGIVIIDKPKWYTNELSKIYSNKNSKKNVWKLLNLQTKRKYVKKKDKKKVEE